MKYVLDKFGVLLQGVAVIVSLMAGAVILVIARLFEKVQGLGR